MSCGRANSIQSLSWGRPPGMRDSPQYQIGSLPGKTVSLWTPEYLNDDGIRRGFCSPSCSLHGWSVGIPMCTILVALSTDIETCVSNQTWCFSYWKEWKLKLRMNNARRMPILLVYRWQMKLHSKLFHLRKAIIIDQVALLHPCVTMSLRKMAIPFLAIIEWCA